MTPEEIRELLDAMREATSAFEELAAIAVAWRGERKLTAKDLADRSRRARVINRCRKLMEEHVEAGRVEAV